MKGPKHLSFCASQLCGRSPPGRTARMAHVSHGPRSLCSSAPTPTSVTHRVPGQLPAEVTALGAICVRSSALCHHLRITQPAWQDRSWCNAVTLRTD